MYTYIYMYIHIHIVTCWRRLSSENSMGSTCTSLRATHSRIHTAFVLHLCPTTGMSDELQRGSGHCLSHSSSLGTKLGGIAVQALQVGESLSESRRFDFIEFLQISWNFHGPHRISFNLSSTLFATNNVCIKETELPHLFQKPFVLTIHRQIQSRGGHNARMIYIYF